jgi:hypothetical protein
MACTRFAGELPVSITRPGNNKAEPLVAIDTPFLRLLYSKSCDNRRIFSRIPVFKMLFFYLYRKKAAGGCTIEFREMI